LNINYLKRAYFLLISAMFLLSTHVSAQDNSFIYKGFAVDQETFSDVSGVHVFNQRGRGTVTNENGYFEIPVYLNDTIMFTRIDYESKSVVISDTSNLSNSIIRLKQKVFILDTVDIYSGIPEPTHLFKKEQRGAYIPGITREIDADQNDKLGFGGSMMSPATALYQAFSKKHKEEQKYRELVKDERERNEVEQKAYERLSEILEIEDIEMEQESYDQLVEYCNLNLDWVARSNNYDLYIRVHDCLSKYVKSSK